MKKGTLGEIATLLRRDVLEATTHAGSGHPSSCLSAADIVSTLFFSEMKYTPSDGRNPDNDEFILSKGHAAPLLYAALKRAGCIKESLNGLRKLDSDLEGHPVPPLNGWVKIATGSLGQGLSAGVGMALAAKLDKRAYRTYVLLGDSECAEGSVWEAVELGAHYKLDNLCAIVDVNRLGQRGETMLGTDVKTYKKRFESFGWNALIVDGHDVEALQKAFTSARTARTPTVLIAQTLKGKGVSVMENKEGWHGKALDERELTYALSELPLVEMPKVVIAKPKVTNVKSEKAQAHTGVHYTAGEQIATREAYGEGLAALARADPSVVVLDAEVSNSTRADKAKAVAPERFIESFIAEQNMIGMALGLAVKGKKAFASTFAAFLSRAHDQLRMAALSKAHFVVCGSHAGVSIGEDGASQMGLEDISLFRALPGSIVLSPSDATSTEKLLHVANTAQGIAYLRTTRPKASQLYTKHDEFSLGDFKVLRQFAHDKVVIIGTGVTVHEALKAHVLLQKERISSAVVDLYSIKPLNAAALEMFVRAHGSRVLIVEDHYHEGGAGEAVASALESSGIPIVHLAVKRTHSGTKDQTLHVGDIDAYAIEREVKRILTPTPHIEAKSERVKLERIKVKPAKKKRKSKY